VASASAATPPTRFAHQVEAPMSAEQAFVPWGRHPRERWRHARRAAVVVAALAVAAASLVSGAISPIPQAQAGCNIYVASGDDVANGHDLCTQLIDTIPTCMARWSQLPAALTVIDQTFQKLNQTLKDALAPFQAGPNGYRWVYVDVYPKFQNHCTNMTVSIYTTVFHPPSTVDTHNSTDVNIGCSNSWFTETYNGNRLPDYLPPASDGVLLTYLQTTMNMGKYPNADGQKCISDAIWDADTIQPGTTPLKWLLGYGEAASTSVCQ
jgi:hypothetical protein